MWKYYVILWNIIEIWRNLFLTEYILKCNLLLWCNAEFSASLLQSSVLQTWSFRNQAQETFPIIFAVENLIFYGNHMETFCQDSLVNRKFKRAEFILNKNICNIVNVLLSLLDQFNVSSLNKSMATLYFRVS